MSVTLLSHQAVTHPDTVKSTAAQILTVVTYDRVYVECYHAFNEGTTNTNAGSFWIQTSLSSTGDEDWVTNTTHTTSTGTPNVEVCTGTEPVGEQTITIASTTGYTVGALIYIRDTVLADSEWAYVREVVSNTSVILIDGLTRAHAATTTSLFSIAEKFTTLVDVTGCSRLRVVYFHEGGTGANTHVKVVASPMDI